MTTTTTSRIVTDTGDAVHRDTGHRRFRPAPRDRRRIALALVLGAAAIGANVLVYTSLDDDEPVVQATRDITAGEQITADMLRRVDASVDDSAAVVPGDRLDELIGRYAKVRIVAGSLVSEPAVQSEPLVSPGRSVVAIQVPTGLIPTGVRERVPVQLVLPARPDGTAIGDATVIDGLVVGLPSAPDALIGAQSVSVEVDAGDAAAVAAADTVRIVLLDPRAADGVEGDG